MKQLYAFSAAIVVLAYSMPGLAHSGPSIAAPIGTDIVADGDLADWPANARAFCLRDFGEGEQMSGALAIDPTFQLAYDPRQRLLYMVVRTDAALAAEQPRVELFVDVDHGRALDRPAHYVLTDKLFVHQTRHEGAVKAERGNTGGEWRAEFAVDLKQLGLAPDAEHSVIGFDLQMTIGDRQFTWTPGEDKWINRRRLGDLLLSGRAETLHQVTGQARWEGRSPAHPPSEVLLRRAGEASFFIRANTDATGRFTVRVPDGLYTLRAADPRTLASLGPKTDVLVRGGDVKLGAPLRAQLVKGDVDSFAPQLMGREEVRAMAVAVIKEGHLSYVRSFGVEESGQPADLNSVFRIASITKPITTMTVMSLAEDGLWDLDEPLHHYWVDPDVAADPRHRQLTSRKVLRHLSGLPNWRGDDKLTFKHDPGTVQSYSGEGFEYMRRAIERKVGRRFEEIARERVFRPAGMDHASYLWPAWAEGRFVGKYYADYLFDYDKPTEASAAADLITRIGDLARFATWTMSGAGLSDELWAEIGRPNADTLLPDPIGDPEAHGLGWAVYPETESTPRLLVHGGSERGIRAYMVLVPSRRDGLIVLTNGSGGVPLIRAVYDATLGQTLDHAPLEAELRRWGAFDQ